MTYATAIAQRNAEIRVLLKIAGVPGYLTSFSATTYDDSAGGNTHGELACYPHIVSTSYSAGRLDHQRHCVSQSTMSVRILDSEFIRGQFSRRATLSYCTEAVDSSETQIDVIDACDGSQAFPAAAPYYASLGRETVKVTAHAANSLATVVRGSLGTTAEAHPIGTPICTTPRHWVGRKAWLVLGCKESGSWVYSDPYRVFRIASSPSYSDGAWDLDLSDGLDFADVSFYVGFEDIRATSFLINGGYVYIYVDDVAQFLESGAPTKQPLHIAISGPGAKRRGAFLCVDVDTDNKRLKFSITQPDLFGGDMMRLFIGSAFGEADDRYMNHNVLHQVDLLCRPVYNIYSQGYAPAEAALRLMLSTTGAAGDNYDLLPGQAATADKAEIRAGCGLTTADVDAASWATAGNGLVPCRQFIVGDDGPEKLSDFLSGEVCPLLGGYWYITHAGKIAFKSYAPASAATSADYSLTTDKIIGGVNAIDDESSVISRVVLWTDYDFATREYNVKHVLSDLVSDHVYGRTAREVEIRSRFAQSGWAENVSLFYDYRSRFGGGSVRYQVRAPWDAHTLEPGDYVSLTSSLLPSQSSSAMGKSSTICEVVGAGVDISSGLVTLELIEAVTTKLVAPAVTVGSNVSGTTWNATLAYGQGALDTEIGTNWHVRAIDSSGNLRAGTTYATGATSTTITLNANIASMAEGDTLVFNDSDGTLETTEEASYTSANQGQYSAISATGTYGGTSADRWS